MRDAGKRRAKARRPGDLVARVVGDTARVQAGLKGFLVHVVTNGVLFLGVSVVLFRLHPGLGLLFGAAGAVTAGLAVAGARSTFRRALKSRKKEGRLADALQDAVSAKDGSAALREIRGHNRSSGRHQAAITRTQGLITWGAHGVFGLAVLAALVLGSRAVAVGRMAAGDMVVFVLYSLQMQGPLVRLSRQVARSGKILGAAHRLVCLLPRPRSSIAKPRAAAKSVVTTESGQPRPASS